MTGVAELLGQAEAAVSAAEDLAALDAVRVQFLGKKGLFTAALRELGKLPPDQIRAAGQAINTVKATLESAIEARRALLEAHRLAAQLAADAIDVTLPGRGEAPGRLHPVTRTLRRMVAILGHAHGKIKGGQHVKYPQDSRFSDLLITLFDRNNIPVEKLGDSGGTFSEI